MPQMFPSFFAMLYLIFFMTFMIFFCSIYWQQPYSLMNSKSLDNKLFKKTSSIKW